MKFNVYVGNHGKRAGIEDYIEFLTASLSSRGHEVAVSMDLAADCDNIIIDEFTNYARNRELARFKGKNPNTRFIYVLTEFVETKYGIRTFNFFGGMVYAAAIAAMTIYFKKTRPDFSPPTLRDYLVGLLHLPLMPVFIAGHLFRNRFGKRKRRVSLTTRLHASAYLLLRYLGLREMIKHADLLLLSHPSISKSLRWIVPAEAHGPLVCGVISPELDVNAISERILEGTEAFVEFTGTITPYRQSFVHAINQEIFRLGMGNTFKICQSISFANSQRRQTRGAFSCHPPQCNNWSYSSPTRIYRALQFDFNIPIITRYFGQHPIEDVCLIYSGAETLEMMDTFFRDRKAAVDFLSPRMAVYNEKVRQANSQAVDAIVAAKRPAQDEAVLQGMAIAA